MLAPFGFTVPFKLAPVAEITVGLFVVAAGSADVELKLADML